jgi:hypothetical protein
MRRRIVMVLLALGAIFGFGSGFAHLAGHHHHGGWRGDWCGRQEAGEARRGESR